MNNSNCLFIDRQNILYHHYHFYAIDIDAKKQNKMTVKVNYFDLFLCLKSFLFSFADAISCFAPIAA